MGGVVLNNLYLFLVINVEIEKLWVMVKIVFIILDVVVCYFIDEVNLWGVVVDFC